VKRIERFMTKRSTRIWHKNIKYAVRKSFADSRLRVKGRFVPKDFHELLAQFLMMV
jgi:CCT motif